MDRITEARTAFEEVYSKDLWGLNTDGYNIPTPGIETEDSRNKRFSTLLQDLITLNGVKSVVEFGCGWWRYMLGVDLTGVSYDGFDVVDRVVNDNRRAYSAPNIRFHRSHPGIRLPKADMLICKDVLQHLPNEDVLYYLSVFKANFRFMVIVNDCFPDDDINGHIAHGGYRGLRLEQAPFNYPNVVLQQWRCVDFGILILKNFCLLQGDQKPDGDGIILE